MLEGSGLEGGALEGSALDGPTLAVVSGTAPGCWGGGLAVVTGAVVSAPGVRPGCSVVPVGGASDELFVGAVASLGSSGISTPSKFSTDWPAITSSM